MREYIMKKNIIIKEEDALIKKNPIILVPAYNPDMKLLTFVKRLVDKGFYVVVINDGSNEASKEVFAAILELDQLDVVNHEVNLGKGRALKTGFNHILVNYPDATGVVTADADDQHTIEDINTCAELIIHEENSLVLGSRNFNLDGIPLKSRIGNKITEWVFRFFVGIKITDTQTGLRGLNISFIRKLMNTPGERFEFETHMLLEAHKSHLKIIETPIHTIYIDDNETTNFRPIIDSMKIYMVIMKYLFSSLSSFLVDYSIFSLIIVLNMFTTMSNNILLATCIARVISSLFNYQVNKNIVFQSGGRKSVYRYYTLAVIQMFVSYIAVRYLYSIDLSNVFVLKILVDIILFSLSFYIQREWVFQNDVSLKVT